MTSPTELAFTGADVEKLTIAGVAATAAGAAMLLLSGEADVDEATNPRSGLVNQPPHPIVTLRSRLDSARLSAGGEDASDVLFGEELGRRRHSRR